MFRRPKMYWEVEEEADKDGIEFNQTMTKALPGEVTLKPTTTGEPGDPATLPYCHTHIAELVRAQTENDSGPSMLKDDHPSTTLEWTQIVLPVICMLGITGNALNLLVLTKRRLSNPMRKLERSANFGLTALAFSDMMFSVTVLPFMFVSKQKQSALPGEAFVLFYKVYGVTAINMFMTISTWMVVMLAVERYIVLFYPLKAKCILGLRRTKLIIMSIYLTAATVMLPSYLHLTVRRCQGLTTSDLYYEIWPRWDGNTHSVRFLGIYIRWICPLLAVFIPLTILSYCNFRLIQGLRRAPLNRKNTCPGQTIKEANNRITLTLVIIVFMALMLVTPAEVLKLFNPYTRWGKIGYHVASFANVLQAINFAFNFILYVAIDSNFRLICRNVLLGRCLGNTPLQLESEVIILNKNTRSSSSEQRCKKTSLSLEKLYG